MFLTVDIFAQKESEFPVRGFCIAAPTPDGIDEFVDFIENDLSERGVNTLVLRVDYNYEYESFPNLRSSNPLTSQDIKKILKSCRSEEIEVIPQVNLLGHQSWAETTGKLLQEYPEFDETPHVEMPEKYEWPNEDGLYCKSYCPRHPEVHDVVFALVDEIVEVFEARAFHAGMDEVFYIGDEKCPRCKGMDKARLFADEVTLIRNHLALKDCELWIWGDRLIDGRTTGIGMWEASMNNTHRAIDMIPKDVVIWDWHYNRAEPTPAFFALKDYRVVSCCWNKPEVARDHVRLIRQLREFSNPEVTSKLLGVAQTVWSPADRFISLLHNPVDDAERMGQVESYRSLFKEVNKK
ncbi:MAG: family 20 glycosylhydrolase [Bacteroidales bacterium]